MSLAERSIDVIRAGQSPSGGYVACPSFEPYRYSWFRDGSFIADAMREVGQVESADRFFDWCARVILASADRAVGCPLPARRRARPFGTGRSCRSTVSASSSARCAGAATPSRWDEAAAHVARWLEHHWSEPCVDWWEEREGVHAATLWCVGNGLGSDEIKREALARADDRLDASLLFIGTEELVARVEASLLVDGGVHRNLDDEYYGGGQWLLLTAMLGLAHVDHGRSDDARACLAWIEAHAEPNGDLPEQSQDHLLRPEWYEPWVQKWGEPPSPLLWSHAMYLRLHHALRDRR